jgi:Helicase conserved C-terminal domain
MRSSSPRLVVVLGCCTGTVYHALFPFQVLVFVRTVDRCQALDKLLKTEGFPSIQMHGNMSQDERIRHYELFRDFHGRILIATNLFGRGMDFCRVNVVINYDMAEDTDTYLHRVSDLVVCHWCDVECAPFVVDCSRGTLRDQGAGYLIRGGEDGCRDAEPSAGTDRRDHFGDAAEDRLQHLHREVRTAEGTDGVRGIQVARHR